MNQTVQEWHYQNYPEDFKPFNLPEIEKAFKKMLANPEVFAWLAKVNDEAIGYLLCIIEEREENEFQYSKTFPLVDQISVEEEYRKRGVAVQLLEKALSLAREKKIKEIQIEHWETNSMARRFFTKNEFTYFRHEMKLSE